MRGRQQNRLSAADRAAAAIAKRLNRQLAAVANRLSSVIVAMAATAATIGVVMRASALIGAGGCIAVLLKTAAVAPGGFAANAIHI